MKKIVILLCLLFPCLVLASNEPISQEVRCLTTNQGKKINVKFVVIYGENGWSGGYLQYEKSKKPITIIPVKEQADVVAEGRPAQITTTWLEMINGKATGEYLTVSQGARIYKFDYKNFNNKKTFHFSENTVAFSDNNCIWN